VRVRWGPLVRQHLLDARLRRRWITAVVFAALTAVPLVGSLGYENGFVTAPIFAGLGMGIGVDAIRRRRAADHVEGHPLHRMLFEGLRELWVLAGIAVGMLLLGQLWQRGCDPWGGLLFFAMGPVLSGALGLVCGLWGGALAQRRPLQMLLAFVPLLACLGVGLWRLYADPVVFAYDPFWGYFSGSVYDEDVAVGATYLWFRTYNLLAAGGAVSAWWLLVDPTTTRLRRRASKRRRIAPILLTAGLTFAAASMGLRPTEFGFTANMRSITEVLAGTYRTEHFVIHYAPRSPDARNIEAIAVEHEFAWHRLHEAMGGRAPDGLVHSFLFATREQKRVLMGAGGVQVAAPWRRQIYLDHRPFPHPVLQHELAHVFGAAIGDPIFGVSRVGARINVALVEGFATAMAPRSADRLDLHDQAAVLHHLKMRPPMAAIMGPGFFASSSSVAYTAAGSFCLWLMDTRGFEPMAQLYRNAGDFEQAYGTSLRELELQWLAFLEGLEIDEDDIEAQRQRFKRTSLFERPCAHRVAEVRKEISRSSLRGFFAEAVEWHRTLCALEPGQPEHRLGLSDALVLSGEYEEATILLDEILEEDLTVTLKAITHERRADLALWTGDLPAAVADYQAAMALPLAESRARGLALKLVGATDPVLAPLVVQYFGLYRTDGDALEQAILRLYEATRIRDLDHYAALGSYLMARQLLNVQDPAAARPLLEDALIMRTADYGLPDAVFLREARLQLLTACVMTRDYDRARDILALMRDDPELGNGHRLDLADWEARIEFFATHHP
jgi:tetratricopeptide (TPR) repeat protein